MGQGALENRGTAIRLNDTPHGVHNMLPLGQTAKFKVQQTLSDLPTVRRRTVVQTGPQSPGKSGQLMAETNQACHIKGSKLGFLGS